MLNVGRGHKNLAVEVAELPLGPIFGAIDADDAKVFGPDLLNRRLDDAGRPPQHGLHEAN